MACVPESICVHLTLGACPCAKSIIACSSNNPVEDDDSREKQQHRRAEEISHAAAVVESPELMLCDDPWKIKKKLTQSDLGYLSRLLIPKDLAEDLVLPVLTRDAQMQVYTENGTKILIWDVDTQSSHYLVFKLWNSSGSYVFIDNWTKDFVKRRGLKKGDEIKLHWDPNKNCFNFSVHYSSN
ncbi:B3 domain-containing protein At2g33720-like [Lotus japonicus]|uniref:B3 domain-containing protein At2g33720-like n=1 Tax=Lotus japonicus TaxID=34305 RepID=UPI00258CE7CC|nr:B3 domain-containing protein At2g33720-like [Lotus japonicus]XP_057432309.1 B3 domain-containing protein At2g33720-like [Lotus japonicus]